MSFALNLYDRPPSLFQPPLWARIRSSKFAFPLRNTVRKRETCLGKPPRPPSFLFLIVVIMPLTSEQRRAYRQADKEQGKKRVSVTLTAEEYNFLKKRAQEAGESPTTYLKNSALHNIADNRHLDQFELDALRSALVEVRRVGNNINQIAHHINAGFAINTDEVKYQMRYLEDTIKKHFGR